jgi:hypothetical protein
MHPALAPPDVMKLFQREDASSLGSGVQDEALDNHGCILYTLR